MSDHKIKTRVKNSGGIGIEMMKPALSSYLRLHPSCAGPNLTFTETVML
jgi:hypothetical protein